MSATAEWRLGSGLEEVGRVVSELQILVAPLLGPRAHDVALAVEELLANAVIHGRRLSGREPRIVVCCSSDQNSMRVEVRDDGPPFDPFDAPAPDLDLPLEERPIGGLGVHLVRSLIDRVEYTREGDENVVVLTHPTNQGGGDQFGL